MEELLSYNETPLNLRININVNPIILLLVYIEGSSMD